LFIRSSSLTNKHLGCVAMRDDYKIYVDAGRPATLNNGAGALTDCATLPEAVLAWHKLAPEQKIRATVKVIGGPVYTAHEIERLTTGQSRREMDHIAQFQTSDESILRELARETIAWHGAAANSNRNWAFFLCAVIERFGPPVDSGGLPRLWVDIWEEECRRANTEEEILGDALQCVLDYIEHSERENYYALPKAEREKHVYHAAQKVRAWILPNRDE
jgi:hypothetical protein